MRRVHRPTDRRRFVPGCTRRRPHPFSDRTDRPADIAAAFVSVYALQVVRARFGRRSVYAATGFLAGPSVKTRGTQITRLLQPRRGFHAPKGRGTRAPVAPLHTTRVNRDRREPIGSDFPRKLRRITVAKR